MKKIISVIAGICVTVCLGGCGSSEADNSSFSDSYDELNSMLSLNYSQISLTVTNRYDENISLVSEYIMNYEADVVRVNYRVERFSEISLDDPLSDGIKTTLSGEAVIKDGKVVSFNGADVGLTANIAETGLHFKEEYFENTDLTGIYLKADVRNVSGFMGSALTCTDMIVYATFLEFFYDIQITYTGENGNLAEYKYIFTI